MSRALSGSHGSYIRRSGAVLPLDPSSYGAMKGLRRWAALRDDQATEERELDALEELERAPFPDRRGSVVERRSVGRPWATGATGRRFTDLPEGDVAAAPRESEAWVEEARAQGA